MALTGTTNEEKIWNYLKAKGLTDFGVAGMMGNLYAESGLLPGNLQNTSNKKLGLTDKQYTDAVDNGTYTRFVNDSAGYGLAQWTYWSRKQSLLKYAKATKKSIGDLEMQLDFLYQELGKLFPSVLSVLKSATSVSQASNCVLLNFERPANQGEEIQKKRAGYGQIYYDKYTGQSGQKGDEPKMSNSPLVSYTKLSPNHSGPRNHVIDTISIHCMAGNLTVERCGALFAKASKGASSNYGIGSDGRIALYVDEANRSWCTSSASNDNRAVTIEVANTVAAHPWPISDAAYKSLIDLLVDICQRNGIKKLLWRADKSLIGQVDKQNMSVHRWFAAKACPGDWLYTRHGQIADEVNSRLGVKDEDTVVDYQAKVTASAGLNCRATPVTGAVVTTYAKDTILHITKERDGWGYTGIGWVSLAYVEKIETDEGEGDDDVDVIRFQELWNEMRKGLQDNDSSNWSREAREWAVESGLIVGSGKCDDGTPNYMWEDVLTREQMATVLYRFAKMMGNA